MELNLGSSALADSAGRAARRSRGIGGTASRQLSQSALRGRGGVGARDHSGAPRLAPLQVQWSVLNRKVAHFRGEGSLKQPFPSPLQVAVSF
jgi:hypothetical protein